MTKKISTLQIRSSLGEILEHVYYKGDEYIIMRKNKPMAALVPVNEYDKYKKQRVKNKKL